MKIVFCTAHRAFSGNSRKNTGAIRAIWGMSYQRAAKGISAISAT